MDDPTCKRVSIIIKKKKVLRNMAMEEGAESNLEKKRE